MQFRLIVSLILAFTLLGCCPRPCKVPMVTRQQICLDLRRQLIFYASDPTQYPVQETANWCSPIRQAMLLKKYRDYDCANVLRECTPATILNY